MLQTLAEDTPPDGLPYWLPQSLSGLWNMLADQPLILAAVILAAGTMLAVSLRFFILFWGLKLTGRTRGELDDKLVRLVANSVLTLLVPLSLIAAVESLPLPDGLETVVTRLLVSVLVLLLMRTALKFAHLFLEALGTMRNRFPLVEERTLPLFDLIATLLIIGAAAYALLMVWNINPTAWLASAGVIGIAVAVAARDTLANLFAGFSIIADAPYKMGDYVVLDTGERGEVTKVGIRSTRLWTRDDVEVTIPNSVMGNAKIVNESGGRWVKYRIRVKVGVAYGSDVDEVCDLLVRVANDHEQVCREPAARVRMRGFGDSSLDFELLCWINEPAQRGLVSHHLYMNIYKALNEAGIEIPFPQRDVWMRRGSAPDKASGGTD